MVRYLIAGDVFEEKKEGLSMRYSEARSQTTRQKRRRVARAGVAEELSKIQRKKNEVTERLSLRRGWS